MIPRDLARIGQLILGKGQWRGHQVVPADWLATLLRPAVTAPAPSGETRQYGYHWYLGSIPLPNRAPSEPTCWVGASGYGGQGLYVVPDLDLILATTFGNYNRSDQGVAPMILLRDIVLPSVVPA